MGFFTKLVPDSLKLPAVFALGLILGAAIMFLPAKWIGASDERKEAQIQATAEALHRIQNLEKNNANFRNLPARDRCLVIMRDSGLSEDNCPER